MLRGQVAEFQSQASRRSASHERHVISRQFRPQASVFPLVMQWIITSPPPGGGVGGASLVTQRVKNPPVMQETGVQSLGGEDPLGKGMATHSSIPAWSIPWTEEPGGLQSLGLQEVGCDWEASTFPFHFSHCGMLWGWVKITYPCTRTHVAYKHS